MYENLHLNNSEIPGTAQDLKIYTKTGDKGTTGLPKAHDLRIDCYGTVDELNSYLGLIRDQENLK